jgi:hypothetical protein
MGVGFEMFGDEPYFIATYTTPFDIAVDYGLILKTAQELSDRRKAQNLPYKVYYVSDVRQINLTFGQLIEGLAMVRQSEAGVMKAVIVGSTEMTQLAAKAVQQKQYGSREETKIFDNVPDALAYAKERISQSD